MENKGKNNEPNGTWVAFINGDENALDELYNAHIVSLFNYGKKIIQDDDAVKDCIQNLFIELWNTRENLSTPRSVKAYLLRALRYQILKTYKPNENIPLDNLPYEYNVSYSEPSYEFRIIGEQISREQKAYLEEELKKLTRRQREAIVLKYFDNLSYEEIASIMKVNNQSVYNLIHQAIAILKKNLVTDFGLILLLQSIIHIV